MTFPARGAFDTDRRVKIRHLRVYTDCLQHLDFCEPRCRTLDEIAFTQRIDRSDASKALRDLIQWGYLRETGRDRYGAREIVLVWSVGKSPTARAADAA